MQAANQNTGTLTVGENLERIKQKIKKTQYNYAKLKNLKHIPNELQHQRLLKRFEVYEKELSELHDKLLHRAIMRRRRRIIREALPTQPMEVKTRWLQYQHDLFANPQTNQ